MFADHLGDVAAGRSQMSRVGAEADAGLAEDLSHFVRVLDDGGEVGMILGA